MPTAAVRSLDSINRVVQAFCSEGVPYKSVSEIAKICRGQVMSKDFLRDNAGEYPVYSSQTDNDGMLGKITTYMFDGEYLTWTTDGANAGTVFYRKGKFSVTNVCGVIDVTDETISTKYLFYVLNREAPQYVNKGMGNPKLMSNVMAKIRIPIPPLAVQQEIVRILDSFTELTTELNEKLTAELTARRKQYEHYRDELLSSNAPRWGNKVIQRRLSEVADISTGSSNTDDAIENGLYPFYVRSQEPLAKNEYEFDEEAIITAGDGVGVGKVFHYVKGKFALHQRAYRIHPTADTLNGRFLYHYFIAKFPAYIGKQMYQGSVPSIRRPMLNNFEVLIPPIEVQQQIVDILDRFDLICSNLTSGLPAEIAARQKQYEYYRDKLLTFKELDV